MSAMLSIEVCYALPDQQTLLELEMPAGTTLGQAIEASGITQKHPEINLTTLKTGIFGKLAPLDTVLSEGDRVEIYRPLIADPKIARQRRVEKARRAGTREGRKWRLKDSS